MNRKWLAALVSIVVLVASYMVIALVVNNKEHSPVAVEGILDLSGWNFRDDGVIALDGQWELIKDQLQNGDEAVGAVRKTAESAFITVPDDWSKELGGAKGMATYKLGIIMPEDGLVMGIKTSTIQLSNRLLINGIAVGASGNPDASAYAGKIKPYAAYFVMKRGYNELLVQVANYDYPLSGGIISSLFLGLSGDIANLKDRANAHGWITISAYLLLGLYFIGLYSQRRADHSLLLLGLVGIMLALYSSATGERLIFELIPDLTVWPYVKIQFTSAIAVCIALLLFIKINYRDYSSLAIIVTGLALNAVLAVLTLSGLFWQLD